MKINKNTRTIWVASETSKGIKVRLSVATGVEKRQIFDLGKELFFDTVEDMKRHCKGEISLTKRKVLTSKSKITSV